MKGRTLVDYDHKGFLRDVRQASWRLGLARGF